jgi:hypothetical protein
MTDYTFPHNSSRSDDVEELGSVLEEDTGYREFFVVLPGKRQKYAATNSSFIYGPNKRRYIT